ncbi:hypothetical protein GCM10010517_20900 [Streptosporangium fragile]|uniref:Integrin-like protein n=1 Tax=Streptosporangium fragile TaxID=46186 RepID=A0ABN3VTS9_9ACTN
MRLLLPLLATAAIALPSAAQATAVRTGAGDPATAPGGARVGTSAGTGAGNCAGTGTATDDFDGDGTDDFATGDPFASPKGLAGAGTAHVLLGRGERGTTVTADGVRAGDGFGWSVRLAEVDADGCADLLVGAPYTDVAGRKDAGAVYVVYGGPRSRTVRLVAPEPEADAHFGWSLASGGTLVAIGAPHEDADGTGDSGAVYLFDTGALGPGRRVTQETEGVSGNGEVGDMFGWSLAIGDMGGTADEPDLAVGLPYENDDGLGRQDGDGKIDSGSIAVIFDVREPRDKYTSKKWDLRQVVAAAAGDRFGYAMAYTEDGGVGYLAVGAPLGDGGGVKDSGLVQLFRATRTVEIAPAATFHQGSEGTAGEGYGFSLALTADGGVRLAVGVPFDGPDRRGGVHLVPVTDPARARLITHDRPGDLFGWSVGFSGNRLVAGVPDRGVSGAVALLGRNDTEGVLLSPGTGGVPALDGGSSADFGASIG